MPTYGSKRSEGGGGWVGDWLSRFTATTAAVIIGGVVILGIVRLYIYWSVRDTVEKIDQKMDQKAMEQKIKQGMMAPK